MFMLGIFAKGNAVKCMFAKLVTQKAYSETPKPIIASQLSKMTVNTRKLRRVLLARWSNFDLEAVNLIVHCPEKLCNDDFLVALASADPSV